MYRYSGYVYVDPSRNRWINTHQSFADKGWIISKVKYGLWEPQDDGSFIVYVKVPQARKTLTVVLVCRRYPNGGSHCSNPDYVHVFGSHILRKKPR